MARTHAAINLDIWSDEDWRRLSVRAQWLYLALLSSPSLSFAGITDWRPARLAALSDDLTADDVRMFTAELIAGRFILVDPSTEEALIRSFVRWDGLLRTPNIVKAMVRDHGTAASTTLRAVFVDELHRVKRKPPLARDGKPSVTPEAWTICRPVLRSTRLGFNDAVETLYGEEGYPEGSDQGSGERSAIRRLLLTPFSMLHSPSPIVTLVTRETATIGIGATP